MTYIMLVFLDLPAPWEAVAAAKETFIQHRTGKICCFSPCIEQVAKTVEALNTNGFVGKEKSKHIFIYHHQLPFY